MRAAIAALDDRIDRAQAAVAKNVTQMRMTLVDSRSGKLLWSHFKASNRDPRKPKDLFQHCKKMLEPLTGKLKLAVPTDRPDKLEPISPVEVEPAASGR